MPTACEPKSNRSLTLSWLPVGDLTAGLTQIALSKRATMIDDPVSDWLAIATLAIFLSCMFYGAVIILT
jgi:hypothetical protein